MLLEIAVVSLFCAMGEGSFISHINTKLFQNLQREKCGPIFHRINWLIQCEHSGRKLKNFFSLLVFSKYSSFSFRDESYKVVKEMY